MNSNDQDGKNLATMKKLQNNFTTQEQSKRLLELGLPADSADCIIKNNKHVYKYNFDMEPTMTQLIERLNTDDCMNVYNHCWSVGRLIEIYCLATGIEYIKIGTSEISLIELMIKMIEIAVKVKTFDFSKLEE
jgi:hypothetical protein